MFFMPHNKSFIDQASSVKMVIYWPRSPVSCHLDRALGQKRPERNRLTKFVWLNQISQQKLAPHIFNLVIVGADFYFKSCCQNRKMCTVITSNKNCLPPKQDDGASEVWQCLAKFGGKKITVRTCITEMITNFFAKYTKICLVSTGPNICRYLVTIIP